MTKSINELNEVLHNTTVEFDLEFVARLMKVLELAESEMVGERTEQKDLVMQYANTLEHEIIHHMSMDDFMDLEDEGMVEIW